MSAHENPHVAASFVYIGKFLFNSLIRANYSLVAISGWPFFIIYLAI